MSPDASSSHGLFDLKTAPSFSSKPNGITIEFSFYWRYWCIDFVHDDEFFNLQFGPIGIGANIESNWSVGVETSGDDRDL